MTSFLSENEISGIGFKSYGIGLKISRYACFYGASEMVLGDCVRIDDFCILSGHIEMGNFIHIAAYSAVYGGDKGVYIDDFVNISSRVSIYAVNDDYSGETMTNPTIPDKYKHVQREKIRIGRHSIVGSTSVILPGVDIAEGSAFGSFSLINRDSEEWSINVGIPFRKLKDRSKKLLEIEKLFEDEMGEKDRRKNNR